MRKHFFLSVAFLCALFFTSSVAFAQDFQKGFRYYVGGTLGPTMTAKNFRNVVISDYIRFPNAEGRATLALGDNQPSGMTFGLVAGADYLLTEKMSGLVEGHFSFGKNVFGVDVFVGGTYNFLAKEKFSLGITPKIGYSLRQTKLGKVTEVRGTPPIVAAGGSFRAGDAIACNISGFAYAFGLTARINASEKFGIRINLGYQGASLSTPQLQVTPTGGGEVFNIDLKSRDVVEFNSRVAANIIPKIGLGGLGANIAVELGF